MRLLAGMGIFKEVGHDTFAPTALAGVFASGSLFSEGVVHMYVNFALTVSIIWLRLKH